MSRSIAFAAGCALAVTGAAAVLVPKALPRPSPRSADGTVVALPPPRSGAAGAGSCLEQAGPMVTLSGSIGRYDTRKTAVAAQRVDARAATWTGTEQWAVNAGRSSAPGLCWSGGVIRGLWPPDTPWDTWHHTGALLLYSPNATVEQVVISDYGDGVRIEDGAQQWTIRQSRVTRAHDDCVENDWEYSGLIEDSFFEGCYVFLSERPASRQTGVRDGSGDTVSIRNSLIYLQPMPTVYRGTAPGTGPLFKFDASGIGSKLVIVNTVVRVDQRPSHGTLEIPAGLVTTGAASCANNTIVWLGEGPYPAALPACFTVTTDREIWKQAVTEWIARHPPPTSQHRIIER